MGELEAFRLIYLGRVRTVLGPGIEADRDPMDFEQYIASLPISGG